MRRLLKIGVASLVILISGCTINNYYTCRCSDGCRCKIGENPLKDDGAVVSPQEIDDTKQDSGAPEMHKDKPWYLL